MAIVLAAGALAAAGCGDDDEDERASGGGRYETPTVETTAPATTETGVAGGGANGRRVVLTDFEIDPANPKARAGKVRFQVVNDGQAPHALEIEGGGEEFATAVLQGGESAELQATLKPGEYEWYCPVGNHADLGMKGTLTVE